MRISHLVRMTAGALVSAGLMGIVLWRVDVRALGRCLAALQPGWGLFVLSLFLPQVVLAAIRWQRLTAPAVSLSLRTSAELFLAASALNLFLPSKLGDFSKAYFSSRTGQVGLRHGTALVVMERYLDLAALAAWMLVGIAIGRWDLAGRLGVAVAAAILGLVPLAYRLVRGQLLVRGIIPSSGLGFRRGVGWSGGLWGCHLLQFYGMFRAVGGHAAAADVLRLVPLGILAGLAPLTIAGIGVRDAALQMLFTDLEPAPRIAVVGLFASFRYLVPGILGFPLLSRYWVRAAEPSRPVI